MLLTYVDKNHIVDVETCYIVNVFHNLNGLNIILLLPYICIERVFQSETNLYISEF